MKLNLEKYGAFAAAQNTVRYRGLNPTSEKVTTIFVEKKLSKAELIALKLEPIPSHFDVVEAKVYLFGKKVRPLSGGLSLGIVGKSVIGTLGGIAYDKVTGEKVGVTNRHVILDTFGITLMSPALHDISDGGGGKMSDFFIGTPKKRSEQYDAVTLELTTDAMANHQYIIGDTVSEFADVKENLIVKKQGRTTGFTNGKVAYFTQIKHPSLALQFENDVLIDGFDSDFSNSGDSGSFIYSDDNKLAALLWGGLKTTDGRNFTIAHLAKDVFENLNLSLTKPKIIDKPDASEPTVTNIDYQTKAVEKLIENYGVKEVKGNSHNPTIVGIINIACNELNLPLSLAKSDETAWCSLVAIYSAIEAERVKDVSRYKQMLVNQGINATARSWEKLDTGLTLDDAKFGDLVVFKRLGSTWKGHIGFYAGNDNENVIVLGGNQSNSINFAKYKSSQLTAVIRLEDAFVKYGTKDNRNEKLV